MVIKQFAADTITRTSIVAPADCNNVWLRCDVSTMTLRSTAGDSATEDVVPPGIPWAIDGAPANQEPRNYRPSVRFSAGDFVVSGLLTAGTGTIVGGFS